MKCISCKKVQTSSPDHICGFCHLRRTLGDMQGIQDAKEFVKNMPIGALESLKAEFFDSSENI